MKYLLTATMLILITINSCSDANVFNRTFEYYIKNEVDEPISLVLFSDISFQNQIDSFSVDAGDSLMVYSCIRSSDEGSCSPFDGINGKSTATDFASIIFNDGMRLDFQRSVETDYNFLLGYIYESYIRPSDRVRIAVYDVDEEKYTLAK